MGRADVPSAARMLWALLLLAVLIEPAAAHIYTLNVAHDTRRVMDLGVFGFHNNGRVILRIKSLSLDDKEAEKSLKHVGFTLDRVSTALMARREKNHGKGAAAQKGICFISDEAIMTAEKAKDLSWRQKYPLETRLMHQSPLQIDFPAVKIRTPGLYALFFYNCKKYANDTETRPVEYTRPPPSVPVSFEVEVELFNIYQNGQVSYASYGKRFLAEMYLGFTFLFLILFAAWAYELVSYRPKVHNIHHLMTVLLVFKIMTLFTETGKEFIARHTGRPSAWSYFYYGFLTLRGIMLFTIIMLIGTGWSFVRPFLNDRDKKLLMFVLPLQILIHVVVCYIEETSEGDASYASWRNALLFLDIICCSVVVIPTIWNIKLMTETKSSDKDALNIIRLRQFRAFYFIVCAYIYFTRLMVPILETMMMYDKTWVAPCLSEIASASFYYVSGDKFKPSNEYAAAPATLKEDIEDSEPLQAMRSASPAKVQRT
eukprot:TRINITY_DN10643_c1_g1_i1.p1 TRINITY_DN10643_c1_g1~~TRINITY_DN10643_c1_g1_i1.p1  ORF type:complete len:485 (+),score=208.57 TRINITY_DN10643_c1_g1_i1:71-1525(+)